MWILDKKDCIKQVAGCDSRNNNINNNVDENARRG